MKKLTFNGVIGGTIITLLFIVAAIGMLWTPFDPMKLSFSARLAAPSAAHLLGTDEFGRDVLSRLMVGAQASVWIGFATVCFAVFFGTLIGLISGYARGWVDGVIMAFNNALLAFPGILLARRKAADRRPAFHAGARPEHSGAVHDLGGAFVQRRLRQVHRYR